MADLPGCPNRLLTVLKKYMLSAQHFNHVLLLINLAGLPQYTPSTKQSFTKTDPLPITHPAVTFTYGLMVAFVPTKVPLPILHPPAITLLGDKVTLSEIFVLWHTVAFKLTIE